MAASGVRPADCAATTPDTAPRRAPPHLGDLVSRQLERLLPIYAPDEGSAAQLRDLLALLGAEALDRPATPPFEGLSFINANGLPFQWVLNLSPRRQGFGFLCEVGRPGASAAARLEQTLDRLDDACRLLQRPAAGFLRDAAAVMLPARDEPWPTHWHSAAWVGVAAGGRAIGLKPYFNLNRGTCRERWLRAGRVLQALGRGCALAHLCALSSVCSPGSWPVGLAFDVMPDGTAGRVKLYFRCEATTLAWLARWCDGAGLTTAAPELRRFLDLFGPVNRRTLMPGAIVVSLEIHADERFSLKTDLAVTKWAAGDAELFEAASAFLGPGAAAETLAGCARAFGVGPAGGDSALLRFVGLGLEPDGACHLNLYLEPPLALPNPANAASAPRRRRKLPLAAAVSVRNGVTALSDALIDDHWEDFALPVGSSDAWVTAYILAMLADLPPDLRARLRSRLAGPLAWLAGRQRPGGGWGYNANVPDDADSTAWAIIALRGWDNTVPATALEFLAQCREGGQFATYPAATSPARAWAAAAPDVSAVVCRALGLPPDPAALAGRCGLATAYWWTSRVYTTAMLLDGVAGPVTSGLGRQLARIVPAGAFERALWLRAAHRAGLAVEAQAAELVQDQRPDGLWPGTARLRLAHDMPGPPSQHIDSGTIYTDTSGLFATATAVAALGRLAAASRTAA